MNKTGKCKIISVVGARPNFIKIAPFIRAIYKYNQNNLNNQIENILVHTGQHYDDCMSNNFFESLGIPEADINLGVGSGSHANQVGNTMILFEKVLELEKPDWVIVVGDVNATLACSVTAKKQQIKVCHIEAGLRSGDITMPEEVNRLVTDRLSDLLLIPDRLSANNLLKEGIPKQRIKFVGNIMIDTLESNRKKANELQISEIIQNNRLNLQQETVHISHTPNNFAVVTMHRPSNVDEKSILEPIIAFFCDEVTQNMTIIWPLHPRILNRIKEFDLWERITNENNLLLLNPIGYHEMLRLNMDARIMFTDSGGLQEECTVLGTPSLTLRWNTERPITLREHGGVSVLVGNNIELIRNEYRKTLVMDRKSLRPELWDGKTANRCVEAIINITH